MKLSIIIPTINRYKDLFNTINYLDNQIFGEFEIIIIDQTEDKNIDIINNISLKKNVTYINSTVKSASAARNIGLLNSTAEIVLFLDDDVIIEDPYFLFKHYRHYEDKNTTGVFGSPIELNSDQSITYHRHWMSKRNSVVGWLYFPSNYGCATTIAVGRSNNLSVRKNIAIDVGGMDENYEKGAHREEGDFCLRVSEKYGDFTFDPRAKLIHIGNAAGGIRSWNDNNYIKAQHNIVGAIYFDLKMAPFKYRFEYLFSTLRYFILNKTIISRPKLYYKVFSRCFNSLIIAIKLYNSGPRYINLN